MAAQGPCDTCWKVEMFVNYSYKFLTTIAEVFDQVRSIETMIFTISRYKCLFLASFGLENGGPRSSGYFLGVKHVRKMSLTTCNDHHISFWPSTANSGLVLNHFSRNSPFFDLFWPGKWRSKVPILLFRGRNCLYIVSINR